jgi:hypothetical protein
MSQVGLRNPRISPPFVMICVGRVHTHIFNALFGVYYTDVQYIISLDGVVIKLLGVGTKSLLLLCN